MVHTPTQLPSLREILADSLALSPLGSPEQHPREDQEDDERDPKRYKRVPNSCVICRRRKIKCGKERPSCLECSKRGITHICHYEDPAWMKPPNGGSVSAPERVQISTDIEAQLKVMSENLKRMEEALTKSENAGLVQTVKVVTSVIPKNELYDPMEPVDLFDTRPYLIPYMLRTSRLEFQGPLSPFFQIKNDPHLNVIWSYMWRCLEKALKTRTHSIMLGAENLLTSEAMKAALMEFLKLKKMNDALQEKIAELQSSDKTLDLLITEHLPKRKVIVTACTRFFKSIHPMIPIIEENVFLTEDLERIVGWTYMSEKVTTINITQENDYALIGLLFMVLALAALTVSPQEYARHPDFTELRSVCTAIYPIIAEKCLSQYKILRRSYNKTVVQVMTLLHLYHQLCPEDDTVSDFSYGKVQLGTLHAISKRYGMHVDSGDLQSTFPCGREMYNLWRKLWLYQVNSDATMAIACGSTPLIQDDTLYDVSLPVIENIRDAGEEAIVRDYQCTEEKDKLYRRVIAALFQRSRNPTIAHIKDLIGELNQYAKDRELDQLCLAIRRSTLQFARVKRAVAYLELHSVILSLHMTLLNHYQKTGNDRMIYETFKSILPLCMDLLNATCNIQSNRILYFTDRMDIYLRPALHMATSRSTLALGSLLSASLHAFSMTESSQSSRISAFKNLRNAMLENFDLARSLAMEINEGYFNMQRINLLMSFFVTMLHDPGLDFEKASRDVVPQFTDDLELRHAHELHGVARKDIPVTSFMTELLVPEIDELTKMLLVDREETKKPFIGSVPTAVPSRRSGMSFKMGRYIHHYGIPGPFIPAPEASQVSTPNVEELLLGHKVPSGPQLVMADSPIYGASSTSSPSSAEDPYKDLPATPMPDDAFNDLFELFNDYDWFQMDKLDAFAGM